MENILINEFSRVLFKMYNSNSDMSFFELYFKNISELHILDMLGLKQIRMLILSSLNVELYQ